MKSCDPDTAIAAAHEVLNDPASLTEPIAMFMPAETLFRHGGKDEALFWYYAAQLRARYQLVFENGDRGQIMAVMMMTLGEGITNYAWYDFRNAQRTIDRVLAWDKTTPNPYQDKQRTAEQNAQVAKVYSGLRDLRAQLGSQGPAMQEKMKELAAQSTPVATVSRPKRCEPGDIDPALAPQEQTSK